MPIQPSFTTTFDRVNNEMVFTDTTNYSAQGYSLGPGIGQSLVWGFLEVKYNTGAGDVVVYSNLPVGTPPPWPVTKDSDSNNTAVVTFATTPTIPLTASGTPIPAQYTITYRVAVFTGLVVEQGTAVNSYSYNFTDPDICIKTAVNCAESAVQSTDDTVYDVPNGNLVSITRAHTLYPPPASGQAVLGPQNLGTLIYTPVFTTTWTAELISTATYLMNDGLTIIVELSGIKEFQVVCDTNLSKILCCLVNLQNEYEAMLCKNPVKAEMFKNTKIDPSLQHLVLFLAAQSAGNQSKMDAQYSQLILASGCGTDCGCTDTTPTIVTPTGGGFTYALTSTGNTIAITTTVSGSAVTWNVELSAALQAAIAAITNTAVSTTTTQFLSVVQTGTAPNLNYRVNFDANEIEKLIVIDPALNVTLDYLEFTQTNIVNQGSKLTAVGSQTVFLGTDVNGAVINPNTAVSYAVFVLANMLVTGTTPITASASVMSSNTTLQVSSVTNLEAEVFHINTTTGAVYIRLYNPQTGQVYTCDDIKLGTWDKIYIKFNLKA